MYALARIAKGTKIVQFVPKRANNRQLTIYGPLATVNILKTYTAIKERK